MFNWANKLAQSNEGKDEPVMVTVGGSWLQLSTGNKNGSDILYKKCQDRDPKVA